MDDVIYALRGVFGYLCCNGLYHDNFWMLLAAPRCRDHHVRNCLSSEEVSLLLGSIERETADGKRDFAAMSLAAASGLRAGDIASLKLEDTDWKKHEIRLVQGKTSEPLVIPVTKTVLNAVADYILNGWPETMDKNVFVRHCAPFTGYHDGVSIACIFRKYQKKAGLLHVVGDGKTLHGMRRGLGTGMAAKGVPVDVVSQVLGHKGTKATKQYISTDLNNLRCCALGLDSAGRWHMMDLHEYIQGMLDYKESLGFSRKTYESYLNDFGKYFFGAGHTDFTAETVRLWCERRDTETPESFRRRVTPLRKLSKYMYAMGYTEYVVPSSIFPITHRNTPYIFTDSELQCLFAESDKEPYCKASPCRHLIIPVIYRLIYFCGLRPNEGRELKRSDFCYKDRTLYIRKNKAHRERLIPVSDDVAAMCHEYLEKSRAVFPDTEYLFPSPTG